MGFCLPINEWANNTISNFVKDNFIKFNNETKWFNQEEVELRLKNLKDDDYRYINSIWTIYFLMIWYKKWF